jgi:raffinose/stachyose/melibiose transport system permease protein
MKGKYKRHGWLRRIGAAVFSYSVILFVLLISLYPLIWTFLGSFKERPGGLGLPGKWVFDGYITIFTKLNIGSYFFNSIMVSVTATVISIFIVAMAAYVSARVPFKGRALVTLMFSSTLFIPAISISFPIYRMMKSLNLDNTLTGLIFIYSGLGIAITFFVIRSYMLSIPREMEEAAKIDGCEYASAFFRIILPLARPGLITAGIMALLNNWNEFYFASILLTDRNKMTIPALLGQFKTAYTRNYNGMFAAVIVSVVPTIVVFCIASNAFIRSLTAGAVKG